MSKNIKTKFSVGQTVYVVDHAEFIFGNSLRRIPWGEPVVVQAVSVFQDKGQLDVRYNVTFDNVPVCWVDEDRLASKVLDVAA